MEIDIQLHIIYISIHTPAKGVTSCRHVYPAMPPNFNPHSREGSDRLLVSSSSQKAAISIHTPAKGVTTSPVSSLNLDMISIHTPAKGVTRAIPVWDCHFIISIHTPAKGVTAMVLNMFHLLVISIHTPAKGVTLSIGMVNDMFIISIHTPAKGVTRVGCEEQALAKLFQSTLPRRE